MHQGNGSGFWIDLPTPAAGTTATYTFAFRRPAAASGGEFTMNLVGANAKNVGLSEANHFNNAATITIRTVD